MVLRDVTVCVTGLLFVFRREVTVTQYVQANNSAMAIMHLCFVLIHWFKIRTSILLVYMNGYEFGLLKQPNMNMRQAYSLPLAPRANLLFGVSLQEGQTVFYDLFHCTSLTQALTFKARN